MNPPLAQVLVNMFLVKNIFTVNISNDMEITENNNVNTVDTVDSNGWQDDHKTLIWILQQLTVDSIIKKMY